MGGCGPCLQRVRVAEKALEVRAGALEPAAAAVVAVCLEAFSEGA